MSLSLGKSGLIVYAMLTNATGHPIKGASLSFAVATDFGTMTLGTSATAANGSATFSTTTLSAGWTAVTSTYKGSSVYNGTSATIALNAASLSKPVNSVAPFVSGQNHFVDLRLVGVPPETSETIMYFFLIVLGCVYFSLIFAVVRAGGIKFAKANRKSE